MPGADRAERCGRLREAPGLAFRSQQYQFPEDLV